MAASQSDGHLFEETEGERGVEGQTRPSCGFATSSQHSAGGNSTKGSVAPSYPAEVFVVGSGLSRALSEQMPTVTELRHPLQQFLDTLPRNTALPAIDDVDPLLSYLAVPQPFLSESENLENEALFRRVAAWLADELFRRQNRCLSEGVIPTWFRRLLRHWHDGRSVVITLKYDTLIEAGSLRSSARSTRSLTSSARCCAPTGR